MYKLETSRLLLRQFEESDLQDYFEYVSMDKVGPMAGWSHYGSLESARERLMIEMKKTLQFALELKEIRKVIGSIEVMDIKTKRFGDIHAEENSKEIGCVLSEKFWGHGYMPEAIKEIIRFCFQELNLAFVYASYVESNSQIKKMDQKCGLYEVGRIKGSETWIDGTVSDLVIVRISKDEFDQKHYSKDGRNENDKDDM